MKTFSDYIEEKLIINKNFKEVLTFDCCKPDKIGKCLLLYFSTTRNDRSHRIDTNLMEYHCEPDKDEIKLSDDRDSYIKNKNGYYWVNYSDKINGLSWIPVLLFKNDAEHFLNVLLDNPHKTFNENDFEDIFASINVNLNWPYHAKKIF